MNISEQLENAKTNAQKIKIIDKYVEDKVKDGHKASRIHAAIKAVLTRKNGGQKNSRSQIQRLVDRYFEIQAMEDADLRFHSMRGWNRSVTCYCNSTNNPEYARRVIKSQITRRNS